MRREFLAAMDDDFNTALAISHLFALAREINKYKQEVENGKPVDGKVVDLLAKTWQLMTSIIGVLEHNTTTVATEEQDALGKLVEKMIACRAQAKLEKNYAQADAIRDTLQAAGIILEDTRQGVRWKKA